jgi:hypothetical protein
MLGNDPRSCCHLLQAAPDHTGDGMCFWRLLSAESSGLPPASLRRVAGFFVSSGNGWNRRSVPH